MEQRTSTVDPIKKRLSMQTEILKRVEELAERMQRRAEEVTTEVHDLEGTAGDAERDLRRAFDSFHRLSDTHFIENIIQEDDQASCSRNKSKSFDNRNVPAQSYEVDILPRYKEAVVLGLQSYEEHMKRANKTYTTRSTFNPWSVRGPLPHIIGSEEYIHDNSCGLIEDLVFGTSYDFNHQGEANGIQPEAEANDLFNPNIFGTEKVPVEENGNEPLASAALDFKAMLEAALRSPYKFYDEELSSHMGSNDTKGAHTEDVTLVSDSIATTSSRFWDFDGSSIPTVGHPSSAGASDIHTNVAAIASDIHAQETPPNDQGVSGISDIIEVSVDETVPTGSPIDSIVERNFDPDEDLNERHHKFISMSGNNEEKYGQKASMEGLNPAEVEEDTICEAYSMAPDNAVRDAISSAIDDNNIVNINEGTFICRPYPEEPETSADIQGSVEDAKEKNSPQLSDVNSRGVTQDCSTGSDHDLQTDI